MSKGKLVLFWNSVHENLINILTYKITLLFFFLSHCGLIVNNPFDFIYILNWEKIKEDNNYSHLNKMEKEGNKRSITQ